MDTLRVGFAGSGGMADEHLRGLSSTDKFPEVHLAAFCDVVLERAQAQADKYKQHGATAYSSVQTMIAEAGLDACYILLPPFAHGDAERACIEGNVPFFMEKPLGLDLGLLRELRDEIQRQNLITSIGYMSRYQPSVQRAKEVFAGDEPVIAYGGWLKEPPTSDDDYLATALFTQWWADKDKSGGQFVEQVTHTVDLARYFLGDVEEVFAHATTAFNKRLPNLLPGYTIDDAMTTSIKFKNGAVASIMGSVATPIGGGVSLDILGMHTAAQFNSSSHHVTITRSDVEGTTVESVAASDDIFAVEDRAFVDAVSTGDRSHIRSDYADAFKTAQVTLGANESAATGKPVNLYSP